MLKSLDIKDYALIDDLHLEFGSGLNILTGETGAGKSILIDAMGLLLGNRASTEVVRNGSVKSIVEGIFNVSKNKKVKNILNENELDTYEELIIRREISQKGANRCFVNDTPVALNVIKEIGELLVDLHGQHDHQSLLRQEMHIEMLDEFAGLDDEVTEFRKKIKKLNDSIIELNELLNKEKELKERKEIVEFQIKEIDEVSPREGEEDELEKELNVLDNSERLIQLTEEVYSGLYDGESNAYDMLGQLANSLEDLSEIDEKFSDKLTELNSAVSIINEVAAFVRSYKDKIDLDPERLEEVRERLGSLNLLKKRYGGSIEAVLELRDKLADELDIAENFSQKKNELEREIATQRKECGILAENLNGKRNKIIPGVQKEIAEALSLLGFSSAVFEVSIKKQEAKSSDQNYLPAQGKNYIYNKFGIDRVEFFISANKGENPKPLVKVASGGEVSRIMLALKTILAKNDKLPVLIFDEIDTGVSGRIAQKVGKALKELSGYHQLIVITHLPQIAGLADIHFMIEKKEEKNRTVTEVKVLNEKERIHEVAKLLSGENVTEAGIISARELINSQK